MESIFKVFLVLHIAGGTLGILAGTFIMFSKKGDKLHKTIGKIFAYSMLGAGFCSLILASIHRNDFLFAIGIFTIFMSGTGWRYIYLKKIADGQKPIWIDWLLFGFMILFGILLIGMGIYSVIQSKYFGIVSAGFGYVGIKMAMKDYKTYKGKLEEKNYWKLSHLQRMIGAYIASITAFLVVNSPESFGFLQWILPSVIIVPFIFKWSNKYRIKLAS